MYPFTRVLQNHIYCPATEKQLGGLPICLLKAIEFVTSSCVLITLSDPVIVWKGPREVIL